MQNHTRICQFCGKDYIPKTSWQKTCSYQCGYYLQNAKNRRGITNFGNCKRCNKSLEHKKSHALYCSRTCKSLDHTFKNRPKTRPVNTARRQDIWLRDQGRCYICQKQVDRFNFELDHLLPISRGGSSDPSNLAVSCRFCNRSRGNTIEPVQLKKLYELRFL
jgi:hypothetical protein